MSNLSDVKMNRIRLENEGVVFSDNTRQVWKEKEKIQRRTEKELHKIQMKI